jgi:GNAT superfamily N-acetyltransferase
MAGEVWNGVAFGTNLGKQAEGWGIYVTPCHRGQNVAQFLQEECHRALERLAFDCVVSHVLLGNEVGERNLETYGWAKQATRYMYRFGKEV